MIMKIAVLSVFAVFLLTCGCVVWPQAGPPVVRISDGGQALHPVCVSTGASQRVRVAATNLAHYLARMTGTDFAVQEGNGRRGIAVGRPEEFPVLAASGVFRPDTPTGREDYLLRTHREGIWLLGATEQGVEHAVWDFLHRLGYRHYFPGKRWEIIPSMPRVEVALDTLQRPSFNSRTLSSATSRSGPDAFGDRRAYLDWMKHNRIADGWRGLGGHIYGFIIRARKDVFEAHPEYLALVDGKRQGQKFCVSNPDLRKLVVDYALERLEREPDVDSISMEPSDGGGFCQCDRCAKVGSISSQVVLLANEVAEAVAERYPGKYVSILAYNYHTAPPEMPLHSNLVVTICAGQLTGNWKPHELFDAWAARGANTHGAGFGVFEYYSNIVGNQFLPGGPRASDIAYLRRTILDFYQRGARRLRSGTAYSNGTVSLGAYLASRMLWDVTASERLDEIYREFLEKTFGAAAPAMDRFFRLIYRFESDEPRLPLTEDKVGRMYRALAEAWTLSDNDAVRGRLGDLVLYTRYAELHLASGTVPASERAEAYTRVMRHAWRMRESMMVNVYGLFAYPRKGMPRERVHWSVPARENPWKHGEAYRETEISQMLRDGVVNNRVGEFMVREFSEDLVPVTALGFADQPGGRYGFGLPPSGSQVFYTWVEPDQQSVRLRVTGGYIWPQRAENVAITLYSDRAVSDAADFVVTTDHSVPPDQQEREVILSTPHAGLHRIEVEGGPAATRVLPAVSNMAFTVQAGPTACFNRRHIWEGFFYVPGGTRAVSFHASQPTGELLDGDGRVAFSFRREWTDADGRTHPAAAGAGYHTVSVPEGQDGRLWKLERTNGVWLFLNVPPYMARRPSELLLPREVVEADAR